MGSVLLVPFLVSEPSLGSLLPHQTHGVSAEFELGEPHLHQTTIIKVEKSQEEGVFRLLVSDF